MQLQEAEVMGEAIDSSNVGFQVIFMSSLSFVPFSWGLGLMCSEK